MFNRSGTWQMTRDQRAVASSTKAGTQNGRKNRNRK